MNETTSLVQVYISGVTGALPNRAYYTTGLNGDYTCRLLGVTWADQTNAKDNRLIKIQSDSFRKISGNMPQSIAFCNRDEHNLGIVHDSFPFLLQCMNGQIDITLSSSVVYSSTTHNAFDFCIITLEATPIPRMP